MFDVDDTESANLANTSKSLFIQLHHLGFMPERATSEANRECDTIQTHLESFKESIQTLKSQFRGKQTLEGIDRDEVNKAAYTACDSFRTIRGATQAMSEQAANAAFTAMGLSFGLPRR
jgi:hypothetical protein